MRSILKGGVWKNTQDEILKVAVMKYGLNQWSRISSLLNRKSANQCKSRWYEWLDPSIKKTPWTREEQERLLHLVKMFPCQWRTISNVIGRTSAQCINHYEKLLDRAQGREPDQNDPRRLRPGEIDPNPQTKPARPDPIDMDDDEKEALQEARGRIGNTRGKKAKRKQREKQLETARRLAHLQKRKEMRAMGIDIKKKIKIKGTDYNAEIPFQRNAPSGRYVPDKSQTPIPDENTVNIAMQQLSQSRRDTAEKKKRQMDIKKFQMLKQQNYEAADAKIKKLREQKMLQDKESRTQLKLPTAVINENQFSEIQKLTNSSGGQALSSMLQLGNLSVNRESNLQSYARTPSNLKDLMSEAKNSYLLINAPTPLLAGIDEKASYEAFKPQESNIEKSTDQLRTTNALLTSVQRAKQEKGIFKEPLPVHNRKNHQQELLIPNQSQIDRSWEEFNDYGIEPSKQLLMEDIKSSISSLPQPKNKKILPNFQQNLLNDRDQESTDIIQLIHNDQLSYKDVPLSLDQIVSQTLAAKSNLPIPQNSISKLKLSEDLDMIQNQFFKKNLEEVANLKDQSNSFSKLILNECDRLILEDQKQLQGGIFQQDSSMQISKKDYKKAEELVKEQMERQEHLQHYSESIRSNYMYFPSFDFISQANDKAISNAEKFQAYQQMLKRNQDCNKRMLKKIETLQSKLNKKLGPFYKKEVGIRQNIQKSLGKSLKLKKQSKIFKILQREEEKAGTQRIKQEQLFLQSLRLKEQGLQKNYTDLALMHQ